MNQGLVLRESLAAGVVGLTLNRPEKRNALSVPLLETFCALLEETSGDETARVVVLRGAGPVFCAGLDLKEASDPSSSHRSADLIARMLRRVHELPQVTIAAVHGSAVAGGAGLLSACDIAIAAEGTRIGYPEVHRGLVAGLVMTFLRRQLGERAARELLLLGELIDAETARRMGLVNRVVPEPRRMEEAMAAAKTALLGAPGAIRASKRLLDALWHSSLEEDFEKARAAHLEARKSDEAAEGMRAFLEKRPPRWRQVLEDSP